MSTASAVFSTVAKYVAISPSPVASPASSTISSVVLPRTIRPLLTVIAPASPASSSNSGYTSGTDEAAPKGKKRRLDHLSWEEKVQRKKLKNRVAAQTSRDRKKARVEEMEGEIDLLTERTEILQNKCESLQTINDSLLEKNQKLDMEVEVLRQQLVELQQQQQELQQQQQQQQQQNASSSAIQQTVATCAGSGLKTGLTVDTRATKAETNDDPSDALAHCGNLPTLQDMQLLLQDVENSDDIDDTIFDASKLEELAESLLADITADLESSDRTCETPPTECRSGAERLSGSVVGTAAERLESGVHSTEAAEDVCMKEETNLTIETETTASDVTQNTLQNKFNLSAEVNGDFNASKNNTATTMTTAALPATPDTVYGTYDARTNSITIVMDDDSVAVNEAVEEIYCDGVAPPADDSTIKCPSPASPSQVYLNVVECSDDEEDLDFDPIARFLCPKRPLVSPLAKSPSLHSTANSDHGYESIIGSPSPNLALDHYEIDDFAWNNSFNELFPTLI